MEKTLNQESKWVVIRIDKELREYLVKLSLGMHDTFCKIIRREIGLDKTRITKGHKNHGKRKSRAS